MTIRPPQSPAARDPTALLLVNTIGAAFVPSAMIFAPCVITSAELPPALITVPGSIVRTAGARTATFVSVGSRYVLQWLQVVLAVIAAGAAITSMLAQP